MCEFKNCVQYTELPCADYQEDIFLKPDCYRKREPEIHAGAREARARQCFNAVSKQERPDIAVALILQAIDDWYEKGLEHGGQGKDA